MPPTRDQQDALDLHNKARQECPGGSRPDLVWCDDLAAAAQKYANKLAVKRLWGHDPKLPLEMGENLGKGRGMTYVIAANGWINEKQYYDGNPISANMKCRGGKDYGHYTQIVWPETSKVGMASATDNEGTTYVVGRYNNPQVQNVSAWDTSDRGILDFLKKHPGATITVMKGPHPGSSGDSSSKGSSLKRRWW